LDWLYYIVVSGVLGVIEGLTEFLPVSSTAHLRIAEAFTPGINMESGYWKMYTVVIQLGAILSVVYLFWPRLMKLLRTFPRGENRNKTIFTHPLSLVMLAFVITAGPCYLAEKSIAKMLENLNAMAVALLVGGIIMWLVDTFCTRPKVMKMEETSVLEAIWIGLVQITSAAFPGTSRSMCTIAAGQLFGMSRAAALEFSFFLSIPTMMAATLYKLSQALLGFPKSHEPPAAWDAPPAQWAVLAVGFFVSFVVAVIINRWFINWVRTRGFGPFAFYRIVLAIVLFVVLWLAPGVLKEKSGHERTSATVPAATR